MSDQFYTLCPKCGKLIKAGLKFCPHCGDRFVAETPPKMVCPGCGKVAPSGEKFCSECGTAYAAQSAPVAQAVASSTETPKTAPTSAPRVQTTPMARSMTQEVFFEKYASRRTKGWAKWLPILGFVSAAIWLVLMIVMFANGNTVTGAFMIVDILAVGGLSCVMYARKRAWPFIALAVYNGIASALAFIDMDFSNLLWLAASIYVAVKMWKVEKAYQEYLRTGNAPEALI